MGNTVSSVNFVQGDSNSFYCGVPSSDTISPPRLPMSLRFDGHDLPLAYTYHYYSTYLSCSLPNSVVLKLVTTICTDMDYIKVTQISPNTVDNTVGTTVYLSGTFIDTNDTVVVGMVPLLAAPPPPPPPSL